MFTLAQNVADSGVRFVDEPDAEKRHALTGLLLPQLDSEPSDA